MIIAFLTGGAYMTSKLPDKRIVGAKQTLKAIKSGMAEKVYLAEDADVRVTVPIIEACKDNSVEVVRVDTMRELGELCSIDVGAAAACVTK
jgi:large subunit ribosomal protein L7A